MTVLATATDRGNAARLRTLLLPVVIAVVVMLVIFVILKVVPPWLASTDEITDATKRADELSSARTAVLAVLAGALGAIGAVYTYRSFELSRQSHELSRQGQITERFTRAVDQLGNRGERRHSTRRDLRA